MRKFIHTVVAGAACAALLAGCQGGASADKAKEPAADQSQSAPAEDSKATFPVTVTHAQGETTIEKQPEKIVCLDTASLDTLDAIGAGDKVVGVPVDSLPTWLKDKYSDRQSTGDLKEPDVEAIAKMQPDLVILGARSAKHYQELSGKFTAVVANTDWKSQEYTEDTVKLINMLGEATGYVDEAKAAGEKITKFAEEHKDAAKDKGKAMVIMVNKGEMSLHGVNSRWNPIFTLFGFEEAMDATPDEGHKAKKISAETVKETNPDYIFVVDRGEAVGKPDPDNPAKKVMDNELVNSTNAAKNGKIVYLSPERWYIVMTGANNYLAELEEIAKAI